MCASVCVGCVCASVNFMQPNVNVGHAQAAAQFRLMLI